MVNWTTFRNTVASLITTLDTIDQCSTVVLLDTARAQMPGNSRAEAKEILEKMERSGLVVRDDRTAFGGVTAPA